MSEYNPERFKSDYCSRSNISEAEFDQFYVVLPCTCDYEGCTGFAAVNNNPSSIKTHSELYAPIVEAAQSAGKGVE